MEARSHAIRLSTGRVLVFLDDDVIPSPGLLSAHLDGYTDQTIGGVAGQVIEATLHPLPIWIRVPSGRMMVGDIQHSITTGKWTFPMHPLATLSLLRQAVVQAGGFDPAFRLAWREDSDLCFRIRALGYRIRFRPSARLTHLSATEGGTRGAPLPVNSWSREMRMYSKYHRHYRDNLYFLLKHFRGKDRLRWVWDAYRTYVGLSRWPWRQAAKNLCFLTALWQADNLARYRKYHPCVLND